MLTIPAVSVRARSPINVVANGIGAPAILSLALECCNALAFLRGKSQTPYSDGMEWEWNYSIRLTLA